jgi:uncharacterized protein (UPF0333 family)
MNLFGKKGQLSLEFSAILLVMILLSTMSIYHFLDNNLSEKERTLDKIGVGAETAVSLINSKYNGTYNKYPVSYLGMKTNGENITIYVYAKQLSNQSKDFIVDYTYNSQKINRSKYYITVEVQ